MKHLFALFLPIVLASCTITTSRPMTEKETRKFNEVKQLAMEVECLLDGVTTLEAYEAAELLDLSSQLKYTYSQDIDSVAQKSCRQLQERIEILQQKIYQTVLKHLPNMHVNVASNADCLLKGKTTYPVYIQRGEKLRVNISSKQAMTVKVYNYDAKSCIKTQSGITKFSYSADIEHTAIYLVEINPSSSSQYASLRIDYTPKSIERLTLTKVNEREVEAQPGDLVFFDHADRDPNATRITHVGMLISQTEVIHCAGWVHVAKIDDMGIRLANGTLSHHLAQIKRYL